ncbi:iron complex transport system permease protein [Paraburkholderia eburnea]|uniref:Iron complex transport system permease protein n=1 Tax=Paraburkholderia eburnea TaxID=1189126 RepID=A0A2S4LVB3_9BURK|nr:Fe(3+)-hydroxamate ABC transporter permease FhuB [Paraburkholderia eburnea]POR46289.1 iron complex transport system permease protein [Paraburkholderia eburnea]PRZ16242.1 iron complex transport system permease protein [Paraburkholderia eburnea]
MNFTRSLTPTLRTNASWQTALVAVALAVMVLAALALSAVNAHAIVPAAQWRSALALDGTRDLQFIILRDSWLSRLVVSLLCGALLGLAGTIFQQVLRNPLAEPMTLGVSAGAQLALTIATLAAPALPAASAAAPQWIALAGAALAAVAVFGLAWRSALAPATVAVAGLIVTLYCGSIGVALQLFYSPYLRALFIWGGGSLVQQDWNNVAMLTPRLLIGGVLAWLLLRPMALFSLDDANARSLGLSLRGARLASLALAVVLSATVAGAVGVIGFVGLAAPALARLAGARRLTERLVAAPLCGALLLWLTDQTVQRFSGLMGDLLPTGAATALFGAPLMLVLLARLHRTTHLPAPTGASAPLHAVSARTLRRRGVLLGALTIAALALALDFGRGPHGWYFATWTQFSHMAIWRAPRTLAALAAGALLAPAGVLMQRLTGNPLASPEVLGVSGGAALGLIALVVLHADAGHGARFAASSAGALAALIAIMGFARRSRFAPDRVLLAGIAIGALFQSVLAVAIAGGNERAATLLQWLAGSTYTVTPVDAALALAACLLLGALTPLCTRWMRILPLGDAPARALGLNTARARAALLMLIAALTACATLLVGPLSFVGLTAPHFARLLGARTPTQQLSIATPLGALTMIVADWLGRAAPMPRELPAGLVATLIAAPYLMWLLARRR